MKIIRIITVTVLAIFAFAQAKSQERIDLDESSRKLVEQRVKEEVGLFTGYLPEIADKKLPLKDRLFYRNAALKLFIGKGENYTEVILDNEGDSIDHVVRKAVTMEVTSLWRKTKNRRPMAKYLTGLANLNYKSVTIQTTKWHEMRVSEIRKIADGKYECTVYFEQIFIGRGDAFTTGDKTKKRVTCHIDVIETDFGLEILVLLGDVEALETKPLNS